MLIMKIYPQYFLLMAIDPAVQSFSFPEIAALDNHLLFFI